ncbi:MAG: MMPL family transporter [Terrimesophilobacter sp.]
MATLLYRLGRFSFRRPWRVIGVWLVLFVAILGGGIALGGQSQEAFAIPGTESQNALDRLEAVFPQVSGASAEAVYVAPAGASVSSPAYEAAIKQMATAMKGVGGISSVTTPFDEYAGKQLSNDGTMAISRIQFDTVSSSVKDATLVGLKKTASIASDAGLRVEFGGQVFQDTSFGITVTEVFGVVFAAVVLLITFGSLLAAGMPLITALLGVGIVIGGITTASAFTTISSSAPLLALMIGLAVGIDYTLFILSRHRNQLAAGDEKENSAATAVGTAGSAVVFAGVTVIIALLGLLVVGIPFLSVMGVGAAFAVLIAIGVATTLLPAMLGLAGNRLRPKPGSRAERRALAHLNAHHGDEAATSVAAIDLTAAPAGSVPTGAATTSATAAAAANNSSRARSRAGRSMGLRWVTAVMRHPIVASVAVVGLLGVLAIPALSLQLSLPDGGSEPANSTQRQAYDLVTKGFGAGYNGPLVVAVDITQTTDIMNDLDRIGNDLRALNGVEWVSQGLPDAGLDTAIIQVVPSSAPDAEATKALVQSIRDLAPSIAATYDTKIFVTGTTAVGIDISNRLSAALVPFGLIVVGLSIVLLMMVFRSVLVPIKAALGFLLSVVAAFGVTVAVFQWGWFGDLLQLTSTGPILSFMPILLMAVLFGLAMDYEVFLVSGMREEFVKTGSPKTAISRGFANGSRVVTAAALIMFFVFFAFVPEGSGMIKPIALGLATGIAFDAFLVRMTLGPALMALMGRAAWWMPGWLARFLPNMDIEGEHLRGHLDAVAWTSLQSGEAVTAERLVVGLGGNGVEQAATQPALHSVGPFDLRVPTGAILCVAGSTLDRRLVAATLAGRLGIVSGRAQIAGHPLPSEAGRVARRVAMMDIGGLERTDADPALGDLLEERLRVTLPWYRAWRSARAAARWISQLNDVLDVRVNVRSNLRDLPRLTRAIALGGVALAERPAMVVLEFSGHLVTADEQAELLCALSALAPSATTIVLSASFADHVQSMTVGGRQVVHLDLRHPASIVDASFVATRNMAAPSAAHLEGSTP